MLYVLAQCNSVDYIFFVKVHNIAGTHTILVSAAVFSKPKSGIKIRLEILLSAKCLDKD